MANIKSCIRTDKQTGEVFIEHKGEYISLKTKDVNKGAKEIEKTAKSKYPKLSEEEALARYLDDLTNIGKFKTPYKSVKEYPRVQKADISVVVKRFGKHGKGLFTKMEREFGNLVSNAVSNNWLRNRQLLSGMSHKSFPDLIVTKTNLPKNELKKFISENNIQRAIKAGVEVPTIVQIKSIYKHFGEVMHPYTEKLIIQYSKQRKNLSLTEEALEKTGGIPGTHAEVLALNELFFKLEQKSITITDNVLKEILGYNKMFLPAEVMPRCADCFYLTELVKMISLN